MPITAFYSGSFDPVTLGHKDVIERTAKFADRLVIGIGVHDAKSPMFTGDERRAMLQQETSQIANCEIEIVTFDNLAVDAANAAGANVIIRGLRSTTDMNYEEQMAGMNAAMAPEVETVFLMASPGVSHIAANLVRQIAKMGGDTRAFVSPHVAKMLATKRS